MPFWFMTLTAIKERLPVHADPAKHVVADRANDAGTVRPMPVVVENLAVVRVAHVRQETGTIATVDARFHPGIRPEAAHQVGVVKIDAGVKQGHHLVGHPLRGPDLIGLDHLQAPEIPRRVKLVVRNPALLDILQLPGQERRAAPPASGSGTARARPSPSRSAPGEEESRSGCYGSRPGRRVVS